MSPTEEAIETAIHAYISVTIERLRHVFPDHIVEVVQENENKRCSIRIDGRPVASAEADDEATPVILLARWAMIMQVMPEKFDGPSIDGP